MNRLLGTLATSLLLVLSGCGPGTTGTGGGDQSPDYLAKAGASASPVCGAPWAASLWCGPTGASAPSVSANDPGTARVQFISGGSALAPDFVLTFEGNRVSLTGGCPRISFDGEWGITAAGKSAFFGGYLDRKLVQAEAAQATVDGLPGPVPAALQLSLRLTADQQVLLPPLVFQRTNTEVQAKPCA